METIIKTKIEVEFDLDVKDLIKTETQEEKQVIVNCSIDATTIRIWPSTYLYPS